MPSTLIVLKDKKKTYVTINANYYYKNEIIDIKKTVL